MVRTVLFAVVSTILVAAAALTSTPAGAQECQPGVYGCPTTTSTTAPGSTGTTIELDVDEGESGTVVRARACGYSEGADVRLDFGGGEVGAGLAGTDGCVTITFTVPEVSPGPYDVCATSPGRPAACAEFTVTGVLGAGQEAGGEDGRGSGAGALARTGAAIGVLALLGLLLVLGGRTLRQAGRDRGPNQVAR